MSTCYTEGYIKTIDLTSGGMKFTLEPAAAFTFEGEEKKKKALIVKKENASGEEKLTVVCSTEGRYLSFEKCGWVCSNTLVTLKTAKCKVRVYLKDADYSKVKRLEIL